MYEAKRVQILATPLPRDASERVIRPAFRPTCEQRETTAAFPELSDYLRATPLCVAAACF